MRLAAMLLTVPLCLLPCSGCERKGDADAPGGDQETSLEDATTKIEEAAETTLDYVAQQKESYEEAMAKKLAQLSKDIDDLAQKTEEAGDEAKAEITDAIDALTKKKRDVERKLDELKSNTPDAWEELRDGLDAAVKELEKSYERAKAAYDSQEG